MLTCFVLLGPTVNTIHAWAQLDQVSNSSRVLTTGSHNVLNSVLNGVLRYAWLTSKWLTSSQGWLCRPI